jgi:hypothetical protein
VNIILVWGANSEADYNWLTIYQKGGVIKVIHGSMVIIRSCDFRQRKKKGGRT